MANTVILYDASNAIVGSFSTIQAAIDAAANGYRIVASAGTYNESLSITKAITLEGEDLGGDGVPDVNLAPTGANGIDISGDIDGGGAESVSISGISITGAAGVGLRISSTTILSDLTVADCNFANNAIHGIGTGSGAPGLGAIAITNSTFQDNGQGGSNGAGDIILFGFNGDATITDVAITSTATMATPVASRGDNAIQISGFDPSTYDVTQPIGNVVLTNVTVDGWYHKPQLQIQGYTDFNGLSLSNVDLDGGTSWGDLLYVDPIVSSGQDAPANPGYPGNFLLTGVADTLDLSGVTINSGSTSVLGVDSRIRGSDGDDSITGTNGADLLNDFAETGVDYGGNDAVSGAGGDDIVIGGAGNDTIDGGSGDDAAIFSGSSTDYAIAELVDANGFATAFTSVFDGNAGDGDDGADNLSSVETLTFLGDGMTLSVLDPVQLFDGSNNLIGTFTTIQGAIDAASDGHTIRIAAGVYNESLTVNKEVAIEGAGAGLAILEGALLTSLGVPSGTPLNDYFEQNNPAYSASVGVNISADNVSFSGFTITAFSEGMAINTSDGVSITDNEFIDNVTGIRKGTTQNVTNIEISDNSFSQGIHGMTIYAAADGSGAFDGVVMNDNSFSALSEKGMYFEQLSNAALNDNVFDDVGNFGRVSPPFGGTQGEFGQAIDINLKYENYQNVVFNDTIITNSGHSDQDGAASPGLFGAAIGVKIRDDAPSYNAQPATFTGSIVFNGGSIDGTSTGFRVGEPGKNNLGPNVEINGTAISNATVTDVENASHPTGGGVTDVIMPVGQNSLDGSASQAPLHVTGTAGGDDIVTGSGDDIISGGAGADTIDGGDGIDTIAYSGSIDDYTLTFGSLSITDNNPGDGDDGADDLSNIENVEFADGTVRVVGGDSDYATIQAAVDASNPGDIIIVRAGVYAEQVVVNGIDDLTIRAAPGEQVTIEAPASLVQTTTSSSGRSVFSIVTIENADNVIIENIDIDGLGNTTGLSGTSPNNTGVYYRNASGGLENVSVTGIHDPYPGGTAVGGEPIQSGNQRGVGVQADNDAGPAKTFFMHGGTIDDFQKNATVFVNCDLDISGVTVIGGGAQTIIAQNGFQAVNSTGSIDGNTITGIGYAGPSFVYSGAILGFSNVDLDITNNTIVGSNDDDLNAKVLGIFAFDTGSPMSGGSVSGNTISFVDTGIGIYGDIQPNEIAISNNTISSIDTTDVFAAGVDHEPNGGLATVFNVEGSAVGDILWGSDGGDTLTALEGEDNIDGGAGDDLIDGGADADDIIAGDGRDDIDAGNGHDTVVGGAGRDTITGGKGADVIFGSGERDRITGDDKNDVLHGDAGNDTLDGGDDEDAIFGGDDDDVMTGGAGDDFMDGGAGADVGDSGSGKDALFGGDGDDSLAASSGRDTLRGGDGNDTLSGGAQRDRFFGGAGDDRLELGNGKDTVYFVLGDDADTVVNFRAGSGSGDLIRLNGFGTAFDTFVEVLAAATDDGSDTTIEFGGGDMLVLEGVLVSELTASDFTFG